MQSSMIVALRTLVMMVSLMAIPLAAVVGTGSWPQVRKWLDGLRTDLLTQFNAEQAAPVETAPVQLSGPPITAAAVTPAPAAPAALPAAVVKEAGPAAATPPPLPKPPFWPATSVSGAHVDRQTTPAAYTAPQNTSPQNATPTSPAPAAPPVAQAPDVLGWIQHRLQTLGATYYRLETAGPRGEMFRFQCKMTSPTNPNYVRYFEATASEPQRAMQHVLDQVDAWIAKGDLSR
jgi:hypothetical protein